MSKHLGDYAPATVLYFMFSTYRPSTGATYTLAGTPVVRVYKNGSTTQHTTTYGVTTDFDSLTGLNYFTIDTSADGTFYSAGGQFSCVLEAGTIDGVSAVGTVVGTFSLNAAAALRPTTAGRTLDVSAGGEAGVDWANVGSPTTTLALTGTSISTATLNAIRKNAALACFSFKMVDATDLKTAETGVTVTATRMIDGATFGACANSVVEDSDGWYHIALAAADLNGDCVVFRFTGTGCHPTEITVYPQPT